MNRTRAVPAVALFLAAFAGACSHNVSRASALDANWTIARATLGGTELPLAAFQGSPLRLRNGSYEFQRDSGSYVTRRGRGDGYDAMDITGVRGPNAGKTFPAIYELHGDSLQICYDLSGKARPSRFASAPGTQQFLALYVRSR